MKLAILTLKKLHKTIKEKLKRKGKTKKSPVQAPVFFRAKKQISSMGKGRKGEGAPLHVPLSQPVIR